MAGNVPCVSAARALSGADASNTAAAAAIDPAPAKIREAPIPRCPNSIAPMPTPVTIARKRL